MAIGIMLYVILLNSFSVKGTSSNLTQTPKDQLVFDFGGQRSHTSFPHKQVHSVDDRV